MKNKSLLSTYVTLALGVLVFLSVIAVVTASMWKTESLMFSIITMTICGLCLGKVVNIIKESYARIKLEKVEKDGR